MKGLWTKISQNGISELDRITAQETKRRIFFNQVLFIGLICVLLQIPSVWPFLGWWSLSFLIIAITLVVCLILNRFQQFNLSKWLYVLVIYAFGIYTTTLMGGALLYHIQSMMILFSCLILFDWNREKFPIILAIPCTVVSVLIGELGWFGAPDFSDHPMAQTTRIMNVFSIVVVTMIFIFFMIHLNRYSENNLSKVVKDLTKASQELEIGKQELETIVQERTSEISKQRDILKLQNEEKKILLQEVHHRVRNNLQIIVSLINLQLDAISSDRTILALREIQSRVSSMSLVHQKMYQSDNFKEIQLIDYTEQIIRNLGELYAVDKVNHTLDIPDEFTLEMDQAIPIGLILNEIVSNYFKHTERSVSFSISLQETEANFNVIYQDDGLGFPEELDVTKLSSLGLQLISNLCEQLDGKCEFFNNNGACYVIRIPRLNLH